MKTKIVVALAALFTLAACSPESDGTPSIEAEAEALHNEEISQGYDAHDLLAVNPDGTLRISDPGQFEELAGEDRELAEEELRRLNDRILRGDAEPLSAEILQQASVMESPRTDIQSSPEAANNECISECTLGACCTSGWWIFCWQHGSC